MKKRKRRERGRKVGYPTKSFVKLLVKIDCFVVYRQNLRTLACSFTSIKFYSMQHMRHIRFQTQQKLENAISYDTLIENSVLRKADANVL